MLLIRHFGLHSFNSYQRPKSLNVQQSKFFFVSFFLYCYCISIIILKRREDMVSLKAFYLAQPRIQHTYIKSRGGIEADLKRYDT